eukprot:403361019
MKLFIRLKGTKNDEFYQIMPLILAYGIRLALEEQILNGNKIFLIEEIFIQLIQFIHNMIYGIDISYSYAKQMKNQYSSTQLQSSPSKTLQDTKKDSSVIHSPSIKKNAFKRRNAQSFNSRMIANNSLSQLEIFDQQMQVFYDEKQIKEFEEKKKRILCPNLKPSFISSQYGKQLRQKQNFSSIDKFQTNVLSPSFLQELANVDTQNPLRDKRKLKHVKSLIPIQLDKFERDYQKLSKTSRNLQSKTSNQKNLEAILEIQSPTHSKIMKRSTSREIIKKEQASFEIPQQNPFLPEDFEKITKKNYRDMKFKVGEEISAEGSVKKSFALRDMHKLRQILKYKPGDKRFNMTEVINIIKKNSKNSPIVDAEMEKVESMTRKYDKDDDSNKIRFPQIKKRKFRNRYDILGDDLLPIDKEKIELENLQKMKLKYIERVNQERNMLNSQNQAQLTGQNIQNLTSKIGAGSQIPDDDYSDDFEQEEIGGRKFQSKFTKDHSEIIVRKTLDKRNNPKKTQLDLINIGEKLRKVKLKMENKNNSIFNSQQTDNEFELIIKELKKDYNSKV